MQSPKIEEELAFRQEIKALNVLQGLWSGRQAKRSSTKEAKEEEDMALSKKQKQRRKELAIRKKQSWKALKKKSRCEWCGSKYNLTVDHVHQRSWGGTDQKSNLRILCRRCHDKRHERDERRKHGNISNRNQMSQLQENQLGDRNSESNNSGNLPQ